MHLDERAVEADRLDLDAEDLLVPNFPEQAIVDAGLGPADHARIDRVQVAEALREAAQLAAVLSDMQDRVGPLEVAERAAAALRRQQRRDPIERRCCDFQAASISTSVNTP